MLQRSCSRCGDFYQPEDLSPERSETPKAELCPGCVERPREPRARDFPEALQRALAATVIAFVTSAALTFQLRLAIILGLTFGLLFLGGSGLAHAEAGARQRIFLISLGTALLAPLLILAQLALDARVVGLALLAALAVLVIAPSLLLLSGWLRLFLAWRRGDSEDVS